MKVRSIFISDVHLGSKYSQAGAFLKFLNKYKPNTIYIVGDFLAGWKLNRTWKHFNKAIIQKLIKFARKGGKIKYAVGNHDDFLLGFLGVYDIVEIQEFFVHTTVHGKRLLVVHGDRFDIVERKAEWVSKAVGWIYDYALYMNGWINYILGRPGCGFCGFLKSRVKALVQVCSGFDSCVKSVSSQYDGLVCGHIHFPVLEEKENFLYCNTGDWVEHQSALIEHTNGVLELKNFNFKIS